MNRYLQNDKYLLKWVLMDSVDRGLVWKVIRPSDVLKTVTLREVKTSNASNSQILSGKIVHSLPIKLSTYSESAPGL